MKIRLLLLQAVLLAAGFAASPATKPRLFVLTDIGGDPDDQMSMVRLMTYANQMNTEGLVAQYDDILRGYILI